jgi:NAD+ diphosphatase
MTGPRPDRPALMLARSSVDRATHLRLDEAALEERWADPRARVIRVHDGTAAVSGDPPRLAFTPPPDQAAAERFFLGIEDGVPYFAVPGAFDLAAGEQSAELRQVGDLLSDRDAGLFVHAAALANWHATHRHCPRCGSPTRSGGGGHVRVCPRDGSEHYPRTDPAVIMLVLDPDERALLGRQPSWPERRFSTLAGFVEPGESVEHAVAREVREEVGVDVTDMEYVGSQPWPFPSSLMLAFRARAEGTALHLDDQEIVEARWFTRDELAGALGRGELLLPPPVSVARRLIEGWYGKESGWDFPADGTGTSAGKHSPRRVAKRPRRR